MVRHLFTFTAMLVLGAAGFGAAPAGQSGQSQQPNLPAHYTAFAVQLGGIHARSGATTVDITVKRWSSDSEKQRLMDALKKGGADKMLDTLQDLEPVGTIRTPNSLAYDLHYAQHTPGKDGGDRIVLATDRRISYWEAVTRPRSIEYPFTFIELHLNDNGEGEGKISLATRVVSSDDGRVLELENYATQPIQLNEVRRRSE